MARRPRSFSAGLVAGVALLFLAREAINALSLADWLVSPLLVADDIRPADAVVVPGAGIVGPCAPNVHGVRRVLHAVRLVKEGRAPFVLIAGGSGEPGCPVAEAMARLAREVGLSADQVRVEPASRSTHENALFAGAMLRGWGVRRILLVTDVLHLTRARRVFMREGFDVAHAGVPVYESHPDNVSMLKAAGREAVAHAYYRARGWFDGRGTVVAAPTVTPPGGPVTYPDGPIVVLGASYAGSWDISSVAGIPVVNRGIDGQQSFELAERFERDVLAARPRAVVVWGFINDIFRAPPDEVDSAVARIKSSYTAMLDAAAAAGVEAIVATEITAGMRQSALDSVASVVGRLRGRVAYQDVINRHVLDVNAWLRGEAGARGLAVLDIQPLLADSSHRRHPVFTQADGSHVTAQGYAVLTAFARPILEERLRAR